MTDLLHIVVRSTVVPVAAGREAFDPGGGKRLLLN
jgi:hypothetical protein